MSASKPAVLPDPVMAAFDDAPTFDEPLEPAEEDAIRAALATAGEGITTAQLLENLRPKE